MTTQSEAQLEKGLISKLNGLGYASVSISDENDLLLNLKEKIEGLNDIKFSDKEFQRVLNILGKGNAFERANLLREKKQHILRDNGKSLYFMLIDQDDISKNSYQVANQVSLKGRYLNRYDVTLFINGLPLVQIELKKRGSDIKQAFNQVIRYKKDSYSSGYGFFQFIQLFVISNGVNTKYFANNRKMLFQQTFYWADKDNKRISYLMEFSSDFLSHKHLMDMVFTYTVLSEEKVAMVLRPYQYFAVKSLVNKVKTSDDFGYVWHTTGSGKNTNFI
jgi:type I restriction enzyme, R subunit